MAFIVSNCAPYLLILQLNSGKTLYLAPRESSPIVDDLEINGNKKITKLLRNSLIAVTPVAETVKVAKSAPTTESPKVATGNLSAPEPLNPAGSEVRPVPPETVEPEKGRAVKPDR